MYPGGCKGRHLSAWVLAGLWLALAGMACAQDTLPDSPRAASSRVDPDGVISPARPDTGTALVVATPPTAPAESTHAFWDTTNIFLFSGVAVVRTMDYVSTQNFLRRGRQEILLPQDVVENHAGFAAIEAAGTATSIGISYLFHRTQHHTMERWVSIVHISVTGFGDVRNYCLKSKHTEQQ